MNEQTRTRRVINRRIKQVETRIQREVILEDGKVIKDSGPKVTTKTIEDYDTKEIEENEEDDRYSQEYNPQNIPSVQRRTRESPTLKQFFFGESPSHYTSYYSKNSEQKTKKSPMHEEQRKDLAHRHYKPTPYWFDENNNKSHSNNSSSNSSRRSSTSTNGIFQQQKTTNLEEFGERDRHVQVEYSDFTRHINQ